MDSVERAYSVLKELGLTKSQYDFSQRWLGQCCAYYSATKARGGEPSIRSLLFLDLELQRMRNALARIHGSPYATQGAKQLKLVGESISLRVRERVTL